MKIKAESIYKIGDRVAERPKAHGIFAIREEVKDRIAQYRTQRYGTVIDITYKRISNGRKQRMLKIQWDHLKSPTEHAQMRICHERDLEQMMKTVIVPGE
jgi:hypothetical protein